MQPYDDDARSSDIDHDLSPPMAEENSQSNENFKVAIRVRPPVPRELEGQREFIDIAKIPADHKSITLCEHLDIDDNRVGVYSTQTFTFDHVYDPSSKQQDVYEISAKPAVMSVLKGYNATLIAYGQTGTGKTYTMEGFTNNDTRGLIPRATEEIFSYIHSCRQKDIKFLVRASYLQIYNEVISDLLKPLNKNLLVRHTNQRGVYVEGLSEWVVRSPNDVYGLMERGCSLRATGTTKMSELSSRSHAMFMIIVEVMEGDEAHPQSYKYGKLNIVDLAGSEKVRQTGVSGQRLEETKKINWSLHELGNVIAALTDVRRKEKHVPFRNSCLTRVLQDSLGGNCKTTLIACISPSLDAYPESLSTLKFANRAKNIKNEATINEDVDQRALLRRYEKELQYLRTLLSEREGAGNVPKQMSRRSPDEDHRAALEALEHTSRAMEEEQMNRKQLEGRIKELESIMGDNDHGVMNADEYAHKLDELDRERQVMEEDKAQVDRYKQLLLKQRDIMLGLTTRLNERDETILHLQEEIDSYDAHIQMLEDVAAEDQHNSLANGDRKSARTSNGFGSSDEKRTMEIVLRDRVEVIAQKLVDQNCAALQKELASVRQRLANSEDKRRVAELTLRNSDVSITQDQQTKFMRLIEKEQEEAKAPLAERLMYATKELENQRAVTKQISTEMDKIKFELSCFRDKLIHTGGGNQQDHAARREIDRMYTVVERIEGSITSAVNICSPRGEKTGRAHYDPQAGVDDIAKMRAQISSLSSINTSLKKENTEYIAKLEEKEARLRAAETAAKNSLNFSGNSSIIMEHKKELAQLNRSLSTHVKDRRALKTILENRIKVKVDNIGDLLVNNGDINRVIGEVRGLQNLVNASVQAMENAEP
eukprot:Tbor_TRINITY_DN5069_c0_g2::TRINITY_DN5069_c0_g2_i1::g.14276::m.14276